MSKENVGLEFRIKRQMNEKYKKNRNKNYRIPF